MSVLGLAPWRPSEESLEIIDQVAQVLEEYKDHLPMTGRQVFYRLVGSFGYPKDEKAYKSLLAKLARARRAGYIPFSAIRDDGVVHRERGFATNPASSLNTAALYLENYSINRQIGQPQYIELWVEAAGMVPQAYSVASRYGIPVYSSGGFNSVTMKHGAASRFIRRFCDESLPAVPTLVLHVGDHDPSGVSIYENLSRDIPQFVADITYDEAGEASELAAMAYRVSQWDRIAVTMDQVREYDLESAPPKPSDSRSRNWEGLTYQVEAMSPSELAEEIEAAILCRWDVDAEEALDVREGAERSKLALAASRLRTAAGAI